MFNFKEEISNCGADGVYILPPEGLKKNSFYSSKCVNEMNDWETGIIDVWDVEIYKVMD